MKRYLIAALALAAPIAADVLPSLAQDDDAVSKHRVPEMANLVCSYLELESAFEVEVRLLGATGDFFQFFAQIGDLDECEPSRAFLLGTGPIDPDGYGALAVPLPSPEAFPPNFEVMFFARYWTEFGQPMVTAPVIFRFNQYPEDKWDFGWGLGGVALPAGLPITEQWGPIGLHIWGQNGFVSPPFTGTAHPDKVILFDSSHPTGGDPDLATPSSGWMNDTPLGSLLIIAENDYDANDDGIVDEPDDEAMGGTIFFDFDHPTTLGQLTLIDIDVGEVANLRAFDGPVLAQDIVIEGRGDGSAITVGFAANPVSHMEIELSGSGGVGGFSMSNCVTLVAFDETTTGVPTRLKTGELLDTQFAPEYGFEISARSNIPGTDRAIVFDTSAPTGDDPDLATPGYHPTNTVPYRKVMILAEDLIDLNGDGLVDDPDDDSNGGVLVVDFDYDVLFQSATVIDIDSYEEAWFESYDADGNLVGLDYLSSLGDNSVETVTPVIGGVRTIELHMTGSGALAELAFCRDDN